MATTGARGEAGATAVEYSLLLGGIVIAAVAVLVALGVRVDAVFTEVDGWFDVLP